MKRFFGIFVLTPREQSLVVFVVIALVVGASIKHYREMKVSDRPETSAAFVSPTPNER